MKENKDEYLEKLVEDIMKNARVEAPSADFTANIMAKVLATKINEIYVYKPLISKSIFFLFSGVLILLFFYNVIYGESQKDSWFNQLNFDVFYNNISVSFLNFSNVTIYAVGLATVLFLVQISFLKKYFDNSINN